MLMTKCENAAHFFCGFRKHDREGHAAIGGQRVRIEGVFKRLKGYMVEIERRRNVLLQSSLELNRRAPELHGKVVEIIGTIKPPELTDEEEIRRREEQDAKEGDQGADLWHARSSHIQIESIRVLHEKPPPGYKGKYEKLD